MLRGAHLHILLRSTRLLLTLSDDGADLPWEAEGRPAQREGKMKAKMKEKWQLASCQQCRAEHQSASDDSPEDALLSCVFACTNSGSILLFLPPPRQWAVHFLPQIAKCRSRVSEFPTFGGLGIGSRGIQKWIHRWILR